MKTNNEKSRTEDDMKCTTDTAVTMMRTQLQDNRSRTRLEYAMYKLCQMAYYGALVGIGYLVFFYVIPAIGQLIGSLVP